MTVDLSNPLAMDGADYRNLFIYAPVLELRVIESCAILALETFNPVLRCQPLASTFWTPLRSRLMRVITREHLEVAVIPAGDCQLRIGVGVFCLGVIIPIVVDSFGPIDKNISCDALRSHDSG